MGYLTRFDLTVQDTDHQMIGGKEQISHDLNQGRYVVLEDVIDELRARSNGARFSLDEWGDALEESKWYDHETDMKVISAKYPSVLFTLKGEGEESGDLWIKYFLDGRMQTAQAEVTFESFDASKLK